MDIKKNFNWVFYGVSIEKKNPRRQSPQGKFFNFLHLDIIFLVCSNFRENGN
jgi:hypothetical protein